MSRKMEWGLLIIALFVGLLIAWVDSRPNWDDTAISAAAVLISSALFGFALPRRAWLVALVVGGWIPLLGITAHRNYGSLLALIIAFVGAYGGVFVRKAVSAMAPETSTAITKPSKPLGRPTKKE